MCFPVNFAKFIEVLIFTDVLLNMCTESINNIPFTIEKKYESTTNIYLGISEIFQKTYFSEHL